MPQTDDPLAVALRAALITFALGVLTLGIKEFLDRFRDFQKQRNELRSLMDLYLTEIVNGVERCNQYVRQGVMGQHSRSKLSLLVGPGKLDRAAALGAAPDSLKSLHDVYRLFDLVQNQVDKNTSEDFAAITAFVMGEFNSINVAVPRLIEYTRELHGKPWTGERLLAKVLNAMWRAQKEFLWGAPAKKPLGLSRLDIDDLEKRFKAAVAETSDWFVANTMFNHMFHADQSDIPQWVDMTKGNSAKVRAKFLRALSAFVTNYSKAVYGGNGVTPVHTDRWAGLVKAGYEIAELTIPAQIPNAHSIQSATAAWSAYWIQHDPQGWDV